MSILGLLVFNQQGRIRVQQYYRRLGLAQQRQLVRQIYHQVLLAFNSSGHGSTANIIEISLDDPAFPADFQHIKILYRSYATLFFVVISPQPLTRQIATESDLALLDFIQVVVETLDKCFDAVCELDLIFRFDQVHWVLNELVSGQGLICETQMDLIIEALREQKRALEARVR